MRKHAGHRLIPLPALLAACLSTPTTNTGAQTRPPAPAETPAMATSPSPMNAAPHPLAVVITNPGLPGPVDMTARTDGTPEDIAARVEAARLSRELLASVHTAYLPKPEISASWTLLARSQWTASSHDPTRPQIVLVVDRNPHIERLTVMLVQANDGEWIPIGTVPVSTGQSGRKNHYITPTGVFTNDTSRLGYRAEGTKNENGIRGLGARGMRVWDFGWQEANKGWHGNGASGPIRLEMHATDPTYLESRLGRPASEGCIRIPAAFNRFMDLNGLIDRDYENASIDDPRFAALLPKSRTPTSIAGNTVIVIDSSPSRGIRG